MNNQNNMDKSYNTQSGFNPNDLKIQNIMVDAQTENKLPTKSSIRVAFTSQIKER